MTNKGLLLALMEPTAPFEEEFHDWYDTEHVPERMVIAGFETGQRYVCLSGWPRYMALYDLTTLDVLRSPEYQKDAGNKVSPWTLRVRTKTVGRYRFTGTQVYPGTANLGDQGAAIRLMLLRFRDVAAMDAAQMITGLKASFRERDDVNQVRLFKHEGDGDGDYLATIEFSSTAESVKLAPRSFGPLIKNLDLINTYTAYSRSDAHKK